jgi:hypothetical protein
MQSNFFVNPLEQIYAVGLTKSTFGALLHCIKFQEFKSLRHYLQTSMHVHTLNLSMNIHIILLGLYKIAHILFLFRYVFVI